MVRDPEALQPAGRLGPAATREALHNVHNLNGRDWELEKIKGLRGGEGLEK